MIDNFTISEPSFFIRNHPDLAGKDSCPLSFSLAREYRRVGLMTEVLRTVIDRLFGAEGFDYISCRYFHFIDASRTLQKKFGFIRLHTERINLNGEEVDCFENILWNPDLHA